LAKAISLYTITALPQKINDMKGLTPRQEQILALIRDQINQFGRPPTRAEIAKTLGYRSTNAAEDHLQALAKKQVIALDASTSRGIRLLGEYAEGLEPPSTQTPNTSNQDESVILPIIGQVAAGSPILSEQHIDKMLTLDPRLFSSRADYLLKVRGLSMKDIGIFDGDLLAVQSTREARSGQVVVARLNDEVTVKRLIKKNGTIELHAENPDFEPILVTPRKDHLEIEGLAVGLIRQSQL
jgi:repressor LexA